MAGPFALHESSNLKKSPLHMGEKRKLMGEKHRGGKTAKKRGLKNGENQVDQVIGKVLSQEIASRKKSRLKHGGKGRVKASEKVSRGYPRESLTTGKPRGKSEQQHLSALAKRWGPPG